MSGFQVNRKILSYLPIQALKELLEDENENYDDIKNETNKEVFISCILGRIEAYRKINDTHAASNSKRVRICGHQVIIKTTSNMKDIVFTGSVYFENIAKFLSIYDNLRCILISKWHKTLFYNKNMTNHLMSVIKQDYGSIADILKIKLQKKDENDITI